MFLKIWLALHFVVHVLQWRMHIEGQNTCGAPYQGELFEDFHGAHSYELYEIYQEYMNEEFLIYQDRFCTQKTGSAVIARLTSLEHLDDVIWELVNGRVNIELMHDSQHEPDCLHIFDKPTVYDGANYKIKMQMKRIQLTVELFRQDSFISGWTVSNISACIHGNLSTFLRLERGGMDSDGVFWHAEAAGNVMRGKQFGKPNLHGNFEGCMGDAMINNIPLLKAANRIMDHDVYPSCRHSFRAACTKACPDTYLSVKDNKCKCPDESEVDDVGLCSRSCNCITCRNGGTCVTVPGSDAECNCPGVYQGQYCEISPCDDVVCQNNGTCSVQPSGPFCNCLPGFTGSRCEVALPDDPCKEVSCQNNATCNSTDDKNVFCDCLPGYYGETCEHYDKVDQKSSPSNWLIPSVIAGVVIIGIAIGIVIYQIWKYRRQAAEAPETVPDGAPVANST